jgi:hypothetical protein
MALSIARSWICSNKSTSNNSHPSLFIQADAECLGLKPVFDKVTCQFALCFSRSCKSPKGGKRSIMKR